MDKSPKGAKRTVNYDRPELQSAPGVEDDHDPSDHHELTVDSIHVERARLLRLSPPR